MRDYTNKEVRIEIYKDALEILKTNPYDEYIRHYECKPKDGLCLLLKSILFDCAYFMCMDENGGTVTWRRTPEFFPEFKELLDEFRTREDWIFTMKWRIETLESCIKQLS